MKTTNKTILGLALIASMGAMGCASDGGGGGKDPVEGDAYLTIVGERNVFMENGWQQALTVRYHDSNNEALAGQIEFAIVGDAAGSTLSTTTKSTNASGEAEIFVTAAATGEASFQVKADAAYADSANWTVSVYGNTPQLPLDPTGRYTVDSKFDIVSGLPGTVGTVVNTFIDMTDGPYDPATWIIDIILEKANLGVVENAIIAARPAIDGILNDVIKSYAPGFVNDVLDIGDKFGQIARHFGTVSTLDIQKMGTVEGNEFSATHTMTHVKFRIDAQVYSYSFAELGMDNAVAANVPFTMDGETSSTLGRHEFPVSYGTLLALALEEIIVPMIDPSANSLAELLLGFVDCQSVGASLHGYVGLGSVDLYVGACELAITAGGNAIVNQIRGIDAQALQLGVTGTAKPVDSNGDRKVDVLFGGVWAGDMTYIGTPAPLGQSTFRAERQNVN